MLTLRQVRSDLAEWATSKTPRVPTGYRCIDGPTGGGPAPGELLLFVARPGVGKTFWALNVVARIPSVPTIMFSLEMHARFVLKRLAAVRTGTPTGTIDAEMRRGSSPAVDQVVEEFRVLAIDDRPGLSVNDMAAAVEDYRDRFKTDPKLIVVDYLELIRHGFGLGETESVKRTAVALKDLAREVDAAVIVLHQASRGPVVRGQQSHPTADEGHRPLTKASAMHGGEAAADYMVGCYRPATAPGLAPHEQMRLGNEIRLQLLKSRGDGDYSTEGVRHWWDQATGRITEIDWSRAVT